ncbi:MAG: hypothetical protein PHZ02_17610, partial [Desulfocapsaceae bacterium]|nr:hypothetical protein [Desulfocapsaceae bacterium]
MPILQETRQAYGLGRIITVADKGINSGDNIAFLMVKGDGFIFPLMSMTAPEMNNAPSSVT